MSNASIPCEFDLNGLTVLDSLAMDGAEFASAVRIRGCSIRHAFFMGAEFQGVVRFGGVDFAGVTFGAVGSFRLEGTEDAVFSLLIGAELKGTLSLVRARLEGSCNLERAKAANLDLTQANLSRPRNLDESRLPSGPCWTKPSSSSRYGYRSRLPPCTVTAPSLPVASALRCPATSLPMAPSFRHLLTFSGLPGPEGRSARVLSLRRADVAGLTVSSLDLGSCLFAGVHHLEGSRLGADLVFGQPPDRWRTPRDVLAEEQRLRRSGDASSRWDDLSQLLPAWFATEGPPRATLPLDPLVVPNASSVTDTYRALRQAREESKDSPGAASFYYGEMEMRREALRGWGLRNSSERTVLRVH